MSLIQLLKKLAAEYEYEWDGFLYRATPKSPSQPAIFYHIAPEGAELYATIHQTAVQKCSGG